MHACILFSVYMYVCYYVCLYAFMHVYVCMCEYEYIIHIYSYILSFVHMGYFVMLWGGGGGTVVSVYSFCILYVLLFVDFLQ